MARLNPYALRVLLEWRHRAEARGQHANRIEPVDLATAIAMRDHGCVGCFRDARTLRSVGHRSGCPVAQGQVSR
jgi:hypothetical protein